jgi:hypothetical protein
MAWLGFGNPRPEANPAQASTLAWLGLTKPWLGWPGFWLEAKARTTLPI